MTRPRHPLATRVGHRGAQTVVEPPERPKQERGELVSVPVHLERLPAGRTTRRSLRNADLYLPPEGKPFGPPLPVRVVPNGDGADVLWTLARFPGTPDRAWADALGSMERELDTFRARHESAPA